jgi:hypothetical protein
MSKTYPSIDSRLEEFIGRQRMFFVATAPLAADGHVNVSPKGLDTFRILGPLDVAYLDFTGSGAETIAHIRENGRVTLMFCAFEGPPKILRLYGEAEIVEPGDEDFDELRSRFDTDVPARSVIRIRLERIADSCGFGVPLYSAQGDRKQIPAWCERKGPEGIAAYQGENNARSIDGLPALRSVVPDDTSAT